MKIYKTMDKLIGNELNNKFSVVDIYCGLHILLNKSLARILISYPGLNEYEIFYLELINKYGDLKINVFS